jgi:YD repeat-containing protein
MLTLTDPTGVTNYGYNALNQQTSKTLPAGAGTFTYTWDGEGNLLTLKDAGGTVTYTYNADDLVSTITDPFAGGVTNVSYDANGAETLRTYPNGVGLSRSVGGRGKTSGVSLFEVVSERSDLPSNHRSALTPSR